MRLDTLLVLVSTCGLNAQAPTSVDICALFRDPVRWNGVMIRVQGTILNGLEGGPWLSGEKCKSHIEVKGETFPNIIQLEDPQDTVRCLHAVDFQLDESAMANFQKMLSRLHPKIEELRVTIIGMFETRAPLADLVQELRQYKDNGFGHMGGAPAQILVHTVTGMHIERKQ